LNYGTRRNDEQRNIEYPMSRFLRGILKYLVIYKNLYSKFSPHSLVGIFYPLNHGTRRKIRNRGIRNKKCPKSNVNISGYQS